MDAHQHDPASPRLVHLLGAWCAGLAGVLAWGWFAAVAFLLLGGGLDGPEQAADVLPLMLTWAGPLVAVGAAGGAGALLASRERSRRAPACWMLRVMWAACLAYGLAWCVWWWGA